jgi:hypothetical protein
MYVRQCREWSNYFIALPPASAETSSDGDSMRPAPVNWNNFLLQSLTTCMRDSGRIEMTTRYDQALRKAVPAREQSRNYYNGMPNDFVPLRR